MFFYFFGPTTTYTRTITSLNSPIALTNFCFTSSIILFDSSIIRFYHQKVISLDQIWIHSLCSWHPTLLLLLHPSSIGRAFFVDPWLLHGKVCPHFRSYNTSWEWVTVVNLLRSYRRTTPHLILSCFWTAAISLITVNNQVALWSRITPSNFIDLIRTKFPLYWTKCEIVYKQENMLSHNSGWLETWYQIRQRTIPIHKLKAHGGCSTEIPLKGNMA